MDSEQALIHLPQELRYLADERPKRLSVPATREPGTFSPPYRDQSTLTKVASSRLASLIHAESDSNEGAVAHPGWLQGRGIPPLLISLRYEDLDAFGASRALAELDLAARRAGAMYRQLAAGGASDRWPEPIRTHRAGLRLLDARVGSFNVIATVWGTLVTIAASSPVSVASLIALAWDVGRGAVHVTKRWRGAVLRQGDGYSRSEASQPWGIKHTKELAPVLAKVIENDQGFEFTLADGDRQLKITVLPRQ